MTGRRFRDLSPRTRNLIIALGVVQVALNVAAQLDITRRSRSEIRGSKIRWRLVSLINIFGPITYFRRGRLPGING
ncbi:MAG: PLDc N-terminal domain-containing protein [Jatrophihabitantaceae bacterium]